MVEKANHLPALLALYWLDGENPLSQTLSKEMSPVPAETTLQHRRRLRETRRRRRRRHRDRPRG